jgi:hypothetical protein
LVLFRTESGDLLAVLDELHTHTLANGRVGLLGLNTDLLEDDTLGVGRTLWWLLASIFNIHHVPFNSNAIHSIPHPLSFATRRVPSGEYVHRRGKT